MLTLLAVQAAWGQTCVFESDGAPTTRLDCAAAGAWRVRCSIEPGTVGKLRARVDVPLRKLQAEARVPLAADGASELTFDLAGPSGRAGDFLVSRPTGGLLPGQAVGPMQLCPVVQPGVAPGSPPAEVTVQVRVTAHRQTGFAETPLDGGVVNRIPVYDQGRAVAEGEGRMVQLPVRDVPIFAGALPTLRDEPVAGTLKLRRDDVWHEVSWRGHLQDLPVDTGSVALLTLDFSRRELERATGDEPAAYLEADLISWMGGGYASLLGASAWERSGVHTPVRERPRFVDVPGGRRSRGARTDTLEIRLLTRGDQLRVAIAHRAAPFDAAVRAAVDAAVRDD